MQSDVKMMFAFLFRTVAACHKTHPVGAYQQAADSPASLQFSISPPWWGHMWPGLSISPLLHYLGRQMPGPARLSLELSCQGSALSANPDLYCMQ